MADGSKPLPGVLRWSIGDLTVTVLNDGYLPGSLDLVTGIPKDEAGRLQAAGFRSTEAPRITLNAFLITGPGREPVLIDTGFGGFGGDTLGRVPAALAATGVRPDEIGTVLLTHLHPDHAGGLLADGKPAYPNAEIVLHEDETAFWLGEGALERAPDDAKPYFEIARDATAPYAARTRRHRGGELLPGITAVPLPGHTPGHTGFRIVSGSTSLMMWTDIVHLPAIQFKQPEAGVSFDVDGDQARAVRRRVLDEVASERSFIAGSHLEFPALGYVVRDGAAYAFVPELWVAAQ
ncbi:MULTISPECIES: MBL fold metallo-hydrolase [Methylobacterium]|uniref:Metallo-beta-lactamase domain-containing protein n=1 Tax=Methylobacterium jeotgali TaxID=381630 RepID=A0ABQ4STH4_9HYPH|nr:MULTISPECIES: MBL fold metallo-hydrolase [Methylobacterium]PIU05556.1 MAG: MBL fold metallo-hydrolase [Methylobacterium sp. CG09_land_8_20_14_0_10_71_15]PIU14039.1 MAG: MBL fold metallo-hydrolase [Methylobacterium sp. CG08_land_8_20_14_0_20_71_15]GBU19720.1 MBL fold metallo-hydrolase [Methylobacterium sp.]GJE05794.1 hypothetical protein AOPFMNJM_1100 [Methylobacterium jeotgali]